ncbi:C13 family peptidase [Sphingomonas sp. LB-2]|uniref:C13 family peptidase n=1 Tax=Sphingomonas caeni TaxID=2984949 RepID=UPI0022302CA0|nr:C13 family peptidase [Sphingomonas caeni]MCW3847235.1 C13 family peptidase [Sphingomonas caeni]
MRFFVPRALIAFLAGVLALPAAAQVVPYKAPEHVSGFPGMASGETQGEMAASLDLGPELDRGRSPRWMLADYRRMDKALAALQPQRKGVVDVYIVSVGLDSDPVFGREAREAGKVLSWRYGGAGRTITLAGTDGSGPSALPNGSITNLTLALARISELMDPKEDVLILYSTSHGAPLGIVYHDADQGFGVLSPKRLAGVLGDLGIRNRLLILSACYSGVFVPALASPTTALFTAASDSRTSFGCASDNDWTFFGDAMINHALRKPQTLKAASDEARGLITQWETKGGVTPSNPQVSIGASVGTWLTPLEARSPKVATQPAGRPATDILDRVRH